MSIAANIQLDRLLSYMKETVFQSGEAYQIQKRITLSGNTTPYYIAIDPTAMTTSSKKLGIFSLSFSSTTGLCLANTYKSTLSTNGTEIGSLKVNENSSFTALTKIYKGSTPNITTAPDTAREYCIGTKSTNQSSGTGSVMVDVTKSLLTTTPTVIQLINQETSDNIITVGIVWFEY